MYSIAVTVTVPGTCISNMVGIGIWDLEHCQKCPFHAFSVGLVGAMIGREKEQKFWNLVVSIRFILVDRSKLQVNQHSRTTCHTLTSSSTSSSVTQVCWIRAFDLAEFTDRRPRNQED